jgi:SAM-dependent methyltransferase
VRRGTAKRLIRLGIPGGLIAALAWPGAALAIRLGASAALLATWTLVYLRYQEEGQRRTRHEWQLLRSANPEAFWRHYNERVPTIEQEFELWGRYHQHRHEMRYDLLARSVREHAPSGGRVLDVGCGAALLADRILDLNATYVGFDFGGPHVGFAAAKFREVPGGPGGARSEAVAPRSTGAPLRTSFARADAERMPFASSSIDIVVMSEVIEHLLRPERAVWEIARVLRPGGVLIMTTNNASEVPLRSPLSHLFAWIEKALGAKHPELISNRPWVWPEKVDRELLPDGVEDVYLPHTHHIQAETSRMFEAAGLETTRWLTFEFPPPQSATAAWLDNRGSLGRRTADAIEWVARRTPIVRRLGTHLFMVARKSGDAVAPDAPPDVWPGPFSVAPPRRVHEQVLVGGGGEYRPEHYWSDLLETDYSFRGIGHLGFSEHYNAWMSRAKRRVLRRALRGIPQPARALDVGSGTGEVVDELLAWGAATEGCDIAQGAVDRLQTRFPGTPFFRVTLGAEPVPQPDATYDLVTVLDVMFHITDDDRWVTAVRDLGRVLRPGGRLIATDGFGDSDETRAENTRMRSLERWRAAVAPSGLRLQSLAPCYRWLSREREVSVLRHLPDRMRGPVEYLLEFAVPRRPHQRCAVFIKTA